LALYVRSGAEPILDKLSALIAAMNEKYGAELGEAHKVWVDQQWTVVKEDDEMRAVAQTPSALQRVRTSLSQARSLLQVAISRRSGAGLRDERCDRNCRWSMVPSSRLEPHPLAQGCPCVRC